MSKTLLTGSVGGWGHFVDFVAKQIKEFCLKIGQNWCNNTVVLCAFQIYKIKTNPLAPFSDIIKFGWEVEPMIACNTATQGPYATNVTFYLICQVFFNYSIFFV